jgi:hypothetical protein
MRASGSVALMMAAAGLHGAHATLGGQAVSPPQQLAQQLEQHQPVRLAAVTVQSEKSELGFQLAQSGAAPIYLEGRIAPNLFLNSERGRWAVEVTPKIRLRVFKAESSPVRSPSFMPRVTVYFWPDRTWDFSQHRPGTFYSARFSHHSNGQAGDFLTADGDINHVDGSFSTNFFELGLHRFFFTRPAPTGGFGIVSVSWEQHVPIDQTAGLKGRYSTSRINVRTNYMYPSQVFREVDLDVALLLGSIQGWSTLDGHRVTAELTGRFAPPQLRDATLFAKGYIGQDYYNNRFDQWVALLQVGLSIDFTTWSPVG